MDSNKFKKCGYECVEWAIRYMETLDERKPLPQVEPGWLWDVCPKEAPQKPESFDKIMKDMEPVCLHGMAHWQHRQFFSYFPAGNSWASIMGDIFSNATGVNGTNWNSCPVVTELEMIVCDWCCKFLGLPNFFLSRMACPESEGAGIVQHSASEAIFYSMMWAREDAVRKLRQKYPTKPRAVLLNMLVAYCNNECHSCVERGSLMGCIHLRKLEPDNEGGIRYATLRKAIEEDMERGLIPFYHCAIIGSTGITSSDDLLVVGPLCEEYGMWLHCDAAYAGSCFSCMEMNHLKHGYEYVWSTNVNTNKWMMCNFEASLHWVRYAAKAVDPMTGWEDDVWKAPLAPNLRHYAVPATRRFRAFKLWCVIRNYGVEGIRRYCRNHINLAKLFEKYCKRDERFEVCGPVRYGLVAFRLRGLNEVTSRLLDALNYSRKIHMVPSHFHDKVVIRFALCAEWANEEDIDTAWRTIDEFASVTIRNFQNENGDDTAMQYLYAKQAKHDELREQRKDARADREEAEAAAVLEELQSKMQKKADGLIKGVDYAAVDGSWDHGDSETFKAFDEALHNNPEVVEEVIYHDPNFSDRVQSMLHIETLEATAKQSSKAGGGKSKGVSIAPSRSKAGVSAASSKAGASAAASKAASSKAVSGATSKAATASGAASASQQAISEEASEQAVSGGASQSQQAISGATSKAASSRATSKAASAAPSGSQAASGGASASQQAISGGASQQAVSGGASKTVSGGSSKSAVSKGPSQQAVSGATSKAASSRATSKAPSAAPSASQAASGAASKAASSRAVSGATSKAPSAAPSGSQAASGGGAIQAVSAIQSMQSAAEEEAGSIQEEGDSLQEEAESILDAEEGSFLEEDGEEEEGDDGA